MRPIMLHGHERSITQIKYNREGDLIFSAAKDPQPNVWYSLNGERLGSFKGHTGAVWCIDVTWDTKNVATGSADNSCRLWDCETGRLLTTLEARNAVRTVNFSFSGKYLMYSTDITMGAQCEIRIVDTFDSAQMKQGAEPGLKMTVPGSKVTSALWEPYENYIVSGHESGELCQFDVRNSEKLHSVTEHNKQINDLQLSKDGTMVITASKDTTAKLFDLETLKHLKTYKTDRPVNSAAISPTREHVVLGGGQEARDVTTTNVRTGKFDAKFFHLIYEEEFAQVKGHFGPINSVAFHPDGNGYSSGGEDGYVRVHQFDPSYLEYDL